MERMTLRQRDLDTIMRIVSSPDEGDPGEPLPWAVLDGLAKLIGVDSVTFQQLDSKRSVAVLTQGFPEQELGPEDDAIDARFWIQYWGCVACSYPDSTGDVVSVTRLSDFYTARELHNTGMWAEVLRPCGSEREMMLCLPSQPGNTLRVVLWRGPGLDFSERDRALLTLLRPHLFAHFRQWRQRQHASTLTPRQWELLRLVADGCTNNQIARRLQVTEGTVRTHLENIFGRLQVSSRAAAVAKAFMDTGDGHEAVEKLRGAARRDQL